MIFVVAFQPLFSILLSLVFQRYKNTIKVSISSRSSSSSSSFSSNMSSDSSTTSVPSPKEEIDFEALPWNLNLPKEHVYLHLTTDKEWPVEGSAEEAALLESLEKTSGGHFYPFADRPLPLTPATTSLNYATTIWEGLKAYRTPDSDSSSSSSSSNVVVFRADANYQRMQNGANEMCLPMPSRSLFLRAIQRTIQNNAHLLPPPRVGMKLYLRPLLMGSGQQLGLYPSPQFSFLVFVSPTGNYFKAATTGLNLHLETRRARAARGGMGSVKCAGNYGAALKPLMDCKQHGFHDNVFLELETLHSASSNSGSNSGSSSNGAIGKAVLQEMSAANLFLVLKTGEIVTPSLDRGTILPGITRSSVLALIEEYADELQPYMMQSLAALNYKDSDKNAVLVTVRASSRDVTVEECLQATEAFCTGTAAELVPIYRLATGPDDDKAFQFEVEFPHGKSLPGGPVTVALLAMLREAMVGKRDIAKKQGWLRDPYAPAQEFMS